MDYEEFYMNIENKNTVIVARIAPGKLPKTYQGTIAQDTLIVDTIKFFHRCLAEGHIKGLDELKVLGSYLYKLLFDANISSVFKDDFDKNEKREDSSTTRLRIILEFKEAASDLAILPWEYIYYPEGQSFLADNNRLSSPVMCRAAISSASSRLIRNLSIFWLLCQSQYTTQARKRMGWNWEPLTRRKP
jgi:hypothetical protein